MGVQSEKGYWARLQGLSQQAHYAVVPSYIAHLRPESPVLEIGCEEGTLVRRLKQIGYRNYTGIDISEFAIGKPRQFNDRKTTFMVGAAKRYVPDATFDVIVLNE